MNRESKTLSAFIGLSFSSLRYVTLIFYWRLWESVTQNLNQGNIDAATDAKSLLEQRQRREAAARLEARQRWIPSYFNEFYRDSTQPITGSTRASTSAAGNHMVYKFKWPLADRICKSSEGFADASGTFQDAPMEWGGRS